MRLAHHSVSKVDRKRLRASRGGDRPAAEALESRTLLSAGDLDPGFSGDGRLFVSDNPVFNRTGEAVAVQSDGKVVVVGTRTATLWSFAAGSFAGPGDVIVARRNADLTPDATFGTGGEVRIDLGGNDTGRSVALDAAGRILVGVASESSDATTWTVFRFLPDGTPDTTFGAGGRVNFPGTQTFVGRLDLEVAPTGRIFAAGATPEGPFSVVAFTPSGRLDTTFGGDGVVAVDFGYDPGYRQITAIAAMPDGRVVAAGIETNLQVPGSASSALVARLNANGSLDTTFDGDGKVVDARAQPGPSELDAAVDGAGRVVLAGTSNGASGFVMRRTRAGAPDTSFGAAGGVVLLGTGGQYPSVRSLALSPNGDVTAAGTLFNTDITRYDFFVARVSAAGLLSARATDDYYNDAYGYGDQGAAVALTAEGKAVVVGTVAVNGFTTYGVSRFNLQPTSAGAEAHAPGPFDGARRQVYATVVQPDRKIVVAGSSVTGRDYNFYLARYNPDGSPDRTFDGDGVVFTDFGADRNDEARALLLRPDGRIVAAGTSRLRSPDRSLSVNDVAVARYNPDGSPDTSFGGGDGRAINSFGPFTTVTDMDAYPGGGFVVSATDRVIRYTASGDLDITFAGDGSIDLPTSSTAVLVQGNKVLVTGYETVGRYNADGTPDTTFASPILPGSSNYLDDLAPAGDERIIVLGTRAVYDPDPETPDVAAWRVNGDGSIDTSFGNGGRATLPSPGFYRFSGGKMAVQPDGKIVAASSGQIYGLGRNRSGTEIVSQVVRWNPDGTPDTAFGLDGATLVYAGLSPTGVALDPVGEVVVAGNLPLSYGIVRLQGSGDGPSLVLDRAEHLLTVRGTTGDDRIDLRVSRGRLFVTVNGRSYNFTRTSFTRAIVNGNDGNDTITLSTPVPSLQVFGGAGNDSIRGSGGSDTLNGGDGNDTLDGGLGHDFLTGGPGTDSLDYRSRTAPIYVDRFYDEENYRLVRYGGEAGEDGLGDDFEKVYGGSGDDSLLAAAGGGAVFGGAGNDTLYGSGGPDALWGDAGDDLLVNSFGADYLRGGSGNDTVSYFVANDFTPVDVSLDEAANDGRAGEGDNAFSDIENVIGSNGSDRISGSAAANRIDGGYGNDTLLGLGGNDTLLGRQGDDTLTDTQGTNTLDGGTGTDTFNGVTEPHQTDILQAEDARLYHTRVNTEHPGYTGRGYVDFGAGAGEYVEWGYSATTAGRRTITFRYANGSLSDRPLDLRLNDTVIHPALSFPPTSWTTWGTVVVQVDLVAGLNRIRLTTPITSGANIDSMAVD